MISRRRLMFAPFAVLVAPLVRQNEEHQELPPPTNQQVYERLLAVETTTWVNSYSIKILAEGQGQIWKHLIRTGWWRPKKYRPT
jgi:hypothetical protein